MTAEERKALLGAIDEQIYRKAVWCEMHNSGHEMSRKVAVGEIKSLYWVRKLIEKTAMEG